MSYLAEHIMKQNQIGPYAPQAEEAPAVEPVVATAAAPAAEPDPRSLTYDPPAGADDPQSNVGKEIKRYTDAGQSQNEAYRLLGGPRQRLGA